VSARNRRRERGAAAVEFALLLPVLLLIVGGIVDFGRFFYTQNITVNASREGARMLALGYPVDGATAADASASKRVQQAMIGFGATAYTTVYTSSTGATITGNTLGCPASPLATDHVSVKVSVNSFGFLVLGPISSLFGGAIPVPQPSGTSDVRCGG
jgi:Flp pilus assembly protein TadG